jgi:hypothetical protein
VKFGQLLSISDYTLKQKFDVALSLWLCIVHRFNKLLQLRAKLHFNIFLIVFVLIEPQDEIDPGRYHPRLCFRFQHSKPLSEITPHAHRPPDAIGKASFMTGVNSTSSLQPFVHQITKSASVAIILGFALSSKAAIRLLSALNIMVKPHPAI